jgi:serine/threonine protein kinase
MSYDNLLVSESSKKRFRQLQSQENIIYTTSEKYQKIIDISIQELNDSYSFVRFLGRGSFGEVKLMRHCSTHQLRAIKVVQKNSPATCQKTLYEIKLGIYLNSPLICKVYGYAEDDEAYYIIMEYLEGMDLYEYIRNNPFIFSNNPEYFWFVVTMILNGITYLHSMNIVHMDIKPENIFILLDNKGKIIGVKLIDLGLSISINYIQKCFRGTPQYMAPEFFDASAEKNFCVDIWSLGITAYAMIMLSLPKQIFSKNRKNIFKKISYLNKMEKFNPFEKTSDDENLKKIEEFIISCLIVKSDIRPTASNLLEKLSIDIYQPDSNIEKIII